MKKFYRLNYLDENDKIIVLFESESREKVDKKKLAYSFKYNAGRMEVEELYKKEKRETNNKSDNNTSLRDGIIMGVSFLSVLLIEFLSKKKEAKK